MLILSREKDESIVIDTTKCPVDELGLIRILVVDVRGPKVRLGIDAPKAMPCHRQEVFDMIDREARLSDLSRIQPADVHVEGV